MTGWRTWQIHSCSYDTSEGPIGLTFRGTLPNKSSVFLAVVGARRMTQYGKAFATTCVTQLARSGVVIVSGFMYGIDAAAHWAALEANGITLAVLGSGLNVPCPSYHERLYDAILEKGGAVVSPFPVHEKARRWMFPQRNKLVAAMSNAVLVIEAAYKSGTLITASYAEEFGKVVMAVPGSVFDNYSCGTNALIRSGAVLVRHAQDVGEVLGIQITNNKSQDANNNIIQIIDNNPKTADEISRIANISIEELLVVLTQLTLCGDVVEEGGKYYAR